MTKKKKVKVPERIWAKTGLYYDYAQDWTEGEWDAEDGDGIGFVRTDLFEALEAENANLKAKLAKAVEALEDIEEDHGLYRAKETLAEIGEMP